MRPRQSPLLVGVLLLLFFAGVLVAAVLLEDTEMATLWSGVTKRQMPLGRILPAAEAFRSSPFVIDSIFAPGRETVLLFANSSSEPEQLSGEATESYRFYTEVKGQVTLSFDIDTANTTPRVWLYNDRGQIASLGRWTHSAESASKRFQIDHPGLYRVRYIYPYERVRKIELEAEVVEKSQSLESYVEDNIKTVHFRLLPGQERRLRRLRELQEKHWETIDINLSRRQLPSPREGILAHVRTDQSDWAVAELRLAGRNAQHKSTLALPSLDVRVRSGGLPYGLQEFKLYGLQAKTDGRDMVLEQLLSDYGIFVYRQDIVRVTLDGDFVGYMQLLEGTEKHLFEFSQNLEGPIVGYDTDAIIANQGGSYYLTRSYFDAPLFPLQEEYDPGRTSFSTEFRGNDMAIVTSFAANYAGFHALVIDLRFNLNPRRGCVQPLVKDFNSGTMSLRSGYNPQYYRSHPFFPALVTLGPIASEWRPHLASYSSYFIHQSGEKEEYQWFFWWGIVTPVLNYFSDPDNYHNFYRFMARLNTAWSRKRVDRRLENMGIAARSLRTVAGTPLALATSINYSRLQDLIPEKVFRAPLSTAPQVHENPQLLQVRNMIYEASNQTITPNTHSLAMLKWRNDLLRAILSIVSSERGYAQTRNHYLDREISSPTATFFYRKEIADSTHLFFLIRSGITDEGVPRVKLLSNDGNARYADKSLVFGQGNANLKFSDLYANMLHLDERLQIEAFRIPKKDEYQYLKPRGIGGNDYLGPFELTIVPRDISRDRSQPLALGDFMIAEDVRLRWKQDAPAVNGPIVIPRQFNWNVPVNTEIRFGPNGCVVVEGNLTIDSGARLHLTSLTPESGWQGIHFHHNEDLSFEGMTVENVGTGSETVSCLDRDYTGGVSFFDTYAKVGDLQIRSSKVEDGLHLLRSEFVLDNVSITGSQSDAIDADFSIPLMQNASLRSNGGDGLDVSGAYVDLRESTLIENGDKNFSIGENFHVQVVGGTFLKGPYGLAVKDASTLRISSSQICDNTIGIGTYIKKPYYSAPELQLGENVHFCRNRLGDIRDIDLEVVLAPSAMPSR